MLFRSIVLVIVVWAWVSCYLKVFQYRVNKCCWNNFDENLYKNIILKNYFIHKKELQQLRNTNLSLAAVVVIIWVRTSRSLEGHKSHFVLHSDLIFPLVIKYLISYQSPFFTGNFYLFLLLSIHICCFFQLMLVQFSFSEHKTTGKRGLIGDQIFYDQRENKIRVEYEM